MHYKKFYGNDAFWNNSFDFNNIIFFKFESENQYVDFPSNHKNRLNILNIKNSKSIKKINNNNYYHATSRLSGETDFNFNSQKYNLFKKKLITDYFQDKKTYNEHIKKLDKCHLLHDTLVNFSLMFVMGNLQSAKSIGYKKDWLDRLDSFILMLELFFQMDKKSRIHSILIKSISRKLSKKNIENLVQYLNSFENVNEYCKKVYFINESLVKKLIKNGKENIDSGEKVVKYMDLAIEFWQEKSLYFLNKDLMVISEYFYNGGEVYTNEFMKLMIKKDLGYEEKDAEILISICLNKGFFYDVGNGIYVR